MKQFPIEDDANGAAAAGIDVDGPLEDDRLDGDQLDEAVDEGWRIDDLAQRAAVAVDTIRYYQREGLLPAGTRVGRSLRYSDEHLERLERIKELQARRFSLAAIRAVLNHEGSLEALLDGRGGAIYHLDALVEAAGVTLEVARGLEEAGVLLSPETHGRSGYDDEDLDVLRAFRHLSDVGAPNPVLIALAEVLNEEVQRVQREVVRIFKADDEALWGTGEQVTFLRNLKHDTSGFVNDFRTISDYVHHRSIQRMVMRAIEWADEPAGNAD